MSLGFNKTLIYQKHPETRCSRNPEIGVLGDQDKKQHSQKSRGLLKKVKTKARSKKSCYWEGQGVASRESQNIVFLFQSVSPISIVVGGQKSCLRILLFFNVVLEAHIHEQM